MAKLLLPVLDRKSGRMLANGWPSGVEICDAMAIRRVLRPVSDQNLTPELLPQDLKG